MSARLSRFERIVGRPIGRNANMRVRWELMTIEEKVEQLYEALETVTSENSKLKKAVEQQNSVIAKMGFQVAKLT
jgi:RPA family protein